MTKLPPGFTHELQQHLQQGDAHGTYDEVKGVPVLDFDRFCCGKFLDFKPLCAMRHLLNAAKSNDIGAHGFSALIVSHHLRYNLYCGYMSMHYLGNIARRRRFATISFDII
jgi:hypothetical protein